MGVVFRQSLKGSLVTFIGAFIGFITTFFITTQILSPTEIGLTRVLFEAASLLSSLSLLGTQSSAVRYYPYFRTTDGKDRGFFTYLMIIPLIGGGVFLSVYLLLRVPLTTYFSRQSDLFSSYYLYVLPLMFFVMYQTILEVYATLRQRVVVPKIIREILLRLILVVVYLVYATGQIDLDIFIGLFILSYGFAAIANLIYTYSLAPYSVRAPIESTTPKVKKDFLRYTTFVTVAALGSSLVSRLDLFMVSSELGLDYGGIYTIAFFIIAIVEIPSRSLLPMVSPQLSEAIKRSDYREVRRIYSKITHLQLVIAGLIFLAIWINIDLIFSLIPRGEVYKQGKWVVFFLGIGKVIDVSFSIGNALLRFSRYYVWGILFTFLVTGLTILFNLLLIRSWGITGAAIATLLTYIISYSFSQGVLYRTMRVIPLNHGTVILLLSITVALSIDFVLPHWGGVLVDATWRNVIILAPTTVWMLSRKESKPIRNEIKTIIRLLQKY